MAQHYDVIVIGGGHNGLVNAAYLAKAGKKVLALERRHVLGGAAVTEEIIPGFLFSECSYVVSLLRPEIIRELDLPRHGLEILPLDGTFTPMLNGDYLWRMNDHARTQREIRRHSRLDAEAYDEFSKMMTPMCRFVKPMLSMIPPDPTTLNPRDLKQLHFMLQRFRSLSSDERYTLDSAHDHEQRRFSRSVVRDRRAESHDVRLGHHRYVPRHPFARHGLRSSAPLHGRNRRRVPFVGIQPRWHRCYFERDRRGGARSRRRNSHASRRSTKFSSRTARTTGVVLKSGEEISATVVSSSVDPHLTFEKFMQPSDLPGEFLEGVRRYKYRGSSGKVNLALDGLPDFKSMPGTGAHLRGAISISPGVEYMERAYDDAKYGNFSRRPYIDMVIPSLTDPSVAPPGKHVLSCFVQYAPYKLAHGTWDDQREAFGDTVVNTIAEHAPNIKKLIVGRQVLTPLDLEREFGLTQGNIFQGELSLEQLFFLRPVPGWAYYRTPIDGLYMCGSATHPGGGIMGAPGRIASQVILKEWKKSASAPRSDRSKPIASNGATSHQYQPPAPTPTPPAAKDAAPHETAALLNESDVTADDVANAPSDSTIAPDSEKN